MSGAVKFTTKSAHRSGSNFIARLVIDNYYVEHSTPGGTTNFIVTYPFEYLESSHGHVEWKHGLFHPQGLNCWSAVLIARNPIKWVNGCMDFCADMWKWWDVNPQRGEDEKLIFKYKDRDISIPRMITKWNKYYREYLEHTTLDFIWYEDLLFDYSRDSFLNYFQTKFNLKRKYDEIKIPTNIQHSDNYTSVKREQEKDLNYHPNLTDIQLDYIINSVDDNLIKLMSERRSYENRGDIQWRA